MIRKLKPLATAFAVVLSLSAMGASMAHATAGSLTAEGKSVTVTGEQIYQHVFSLTDHGLEGSSAQIACGKAHFHGFGKVTDGATSARVTPTYFECSGLAFGLGSQIFHEECQYVLSTGTPSPATGWHVNTSIACPEGKSIRIITQTCEITVGSQGPLTSSAVTNSGGAGTAMELLLHTNIDGIHYTVVKDGVGCPLSGTGTFKDGDYKGSTTVEGLGALGDPVGITLDDLTHQPSGLLVATGEQVGENALLFTDHLVGGNPAAAKCKSATLTGTSPVKQVEAELPVHPVYKECTAFGLPATITTTGCDYLFHIGAATTGGWHATKDIACSAGATIRIVAQTCEVTVGQQSGLATSEVTNSGGSGTAMDLLLHMSITGMNYTVVKDGIGCPLSGTGTFSKGDHTGTATIEAHDSGNGTPAGITVPPPPAIATGEQVGENTLQLTDHLIEGAPAAVKCKTMKFTGTEPLPAGLGTIRAHPVYEGCTAFGQAATITTTGCDYLLHVGTATAGGWHVTTDVVCTASSLMKIATASCEVTVGAQVGLTTSEVTNAGTEAAMDLLLHTGITGVHYTVAKDGTGCPLSGIGNFSQGDYTGTTTIKAHDAATLEPVDITKN